MSPKIFFGFIHIFLYKSILQDIVVINCNEEVQQEEILPDNFVAAVQHPDMPEDTHHISHEVQQDYSFLI